MIKIIVALFFLLSPAFARADFKSSSSCKKCHEDIYQQWQSSMHANATLEKDPLFAGMYSWASQDGGNKLTDKCQDCHSPMSLVFHSTERGAICNSEGVTCQFCHGAEKINGFRSARDFQIDLSAIYGTTVDTANAAHPVEFRE
ncbi:MAG: multiheme c-type cytochrome, partial [Calditrichia bacterium]